MLKAQSSFSILWKSHSKQSITLCCLTNSIVLVVWPRSTSEIKFWPHNHNTDQCPLPIYSVYAFIEIWINIKLNSLVWQHICDEIEWKMENEGNGRQAGGQADRQRWRNFDRISWLANSLYMYEFIVFTIRSILAYLIGKVYVYSELYTLEK